MAPSLSIPQTDGFGEQSELGLAQLLQQKLKLFGGKMAIKSDNHFITYAELHQKALYLVREIQKHQIRREEPIGVLAHRGINQVLAQVAVVYAGGTCVPLDIDHPDQHLENLLLNLKTSIVLTDLAHCGRMPCFQHITVDHTLGKKEFVDDIKVSSNQPTSCAYIFHTSGSTGKPKAVQVLAMGIINLILNFDPVLERHRLAHVCNVIFDVSVFEIWSALLRGAMLVIYQRDLILDPMAFAQRLQEDKIDVLFQTPALLATIAHICPQAYSTIDTLLTGGEAINPQIIKTIMEKGPPARVFNLYGPTECSIFTTIHEVCFEDIEGANIPIGRPLRNYEVFVVDEELQPVKQGDLGELLVGGVGVAAGYFNEPEKTSKVFVSAPNLSTKGKIGTGMLYRTGDLGRINEAGLIEYSGRRDNQVKILGQRIELESIEFLLLETKLVSAAAALKVDADELKGSSLLVAYVVPSSSDIDVQSIKQSFAKLAPHLLIPRLELVENLALTAGGKVDRKKLVRHYLDRIKLAHNSELSKANGPTAGTHSLLQGIWLEVLGLGGNVSGPKTTDSFFSLGGTSLHAARLVSIIRQALGLNIPVSVLLQNPTLEDMFTVIDKIKNGVQLQDSTRDKNSWLRDSELGKDLKPLLGCSHNWRCESEGRVFMTGATGFIGAFLLAELLTLPETETVACLVRAKDTSTAGLRIKKTLEKYRLWPTSPDQQTKILAIPGDFSQADLGLGRERFDHFAQWASVVFHLGAYVSFVHTYAAHRASNVLGTFYMLRFANTKRRKELHYASSISAYGPTGLVTGATHLPEDERPAGHLTALMYDTGYAQSQFVAEAVVWNAIDNGLPVTIYRPGFVLGHTKTGVANPDDFFGRLMVSCMETGYYPLLPRQREEFVPVDFVVSGMLHIASCNDNCGHAYNLIHPKPGVTSELQAIFDLINGLSPPSQLKGIPYDNWVSSLSREKGNRLLPLMPMLEEKVLGNLTRWEAQQSMAIFGTENLRRALATAPGLLQCPPIASLLQVYMSFWMQTTLP